MIRRDAIENIMEYIDDEIVVCNIGFPSKELYDVKDRDENFYMIGSMGLVSSIALGLAIAKKDKEVVVIDGDGAFLMNLNSIITTFVEKPDNLTWIVIDNGAYGSTGNQKTYANDINLLEIAKSVGFENAYEFEDIDLKEVINNKKCSFIRYSVEPGNSPAPVIPLSPEEIKERFMEAISK